ncbi:MAG: ATP phosphoribosyltransferase [Firmicutes bacterium]|nr:ATP phosphoribosyltransferase [Bacillota bacterium]
MLAANDWLTIALAKGRILPPTLELFTAAGINCSPIESDTRKLIFRLETEKLQFILAKPTDIPTYVEYGVADLGVVGKDILWEQEKELYELLDLKLGACRLSAAHKAGQTDFTRGGTVTYVATKYPNIAKRHYLKKGRQVEIIKLHGSIELAPLLNLADVIVDLVSTGKTLRENNLVEAEVIARITARLVANPGSYQVKAKRVMTLVQQLEKALQKRCGDDKNL